MSHKFQVLLVHGWTASHQVTTSLTDADYIFPRQAIDPGIALGPVCICRVVAATPSGTGILGVLLPGRTWSRVARLSTRVWLRETSSNHCFIAASFRERLGSKLAARRHHSRAPTASWFQVDAGERPFVIDPTLPQLQRCHGDSSHVDSKFKTAIPETETTYIICTRTLVRTIVRQSTNSLP